MLNFDADATAELMRQLEAYEGRLLRTLESYSRFDQRSPECRSAAYELYGVRRTLTRLRDELLAMPSPAREASHA